MKKVRLTVTESRCRGGYCRAGDTYLVEDLCPPVCHELWNTIYPMVYALQNGGDLDCGSGRAKQFEAACPDGGRVKIHGEVWEEPGETMAERDIRIRPAVPGDYQAVREILLQAQQMHVAWRPDIYRANEDLLPEAYFEETVERGGFFVAELDGTVAGILEIQRRHVESPAHVTRDVLFIDTMAVAEAYRGMGIGHAFFRFVRQRKKEEKLDGIELQGDARNASAIRMYESCGFTGKSIHMERLEENDESEKRFPAKNVK